MKEKKKKFVKWIKDSESVSLSCILDFIREAKQQGKESVSLDIIIVEKQEGGLVAWEE